MCESLLFCSQQKLVLHSSFPYKVDLQLSIRHHDSPFQVRPTNPHTLTTSHPHSLTPSQLQSLPGSGQVAVLPDEQLPVHVTFAPVRGVVSCTALDILDHTHNRKYRVCALEIMYMYSIIIHAVVGVTVSEVILCVCLCHVVWWSDPALWVRGIWKT